MPELVACAPPGDEADIVSLKKGHVSGLSSHARESGYCVTIEADSALLFIGGTAAVRINAGREIIFEPMPGATEKLIRLFLLGPSLSMVLHQRGQLVLHAAAIALNSEPGHRFVVGFLGESGQGKSTMAAACYERGHAIVADDAIALQASSFMPPTNAASDYAAEPYPLLYPGFPRLKLRAPSVAALYEGKEVLSLLDDEHLPHARSEKPTPLGFSSELMPLRHLYVLEDAEELKVVALTRKEALLHLIRNSYWIADLPARQRQENFAQCQHLASRLSVFRLQRPRDFGRLNDVLDLVEHHARTGSAGA